MYLQTNVSGQIRTCEKHDGAELNKFLKKQFIIEWYPINFPQQKYSSRLLFMIVRNQYRLIILISI